MKRAIIASILGVAVSATTGFGQGQIYFVTYISSMVVVPVVWGVGPGHSAGSAVVGSDGLTATLYYGIGSGLTFAQLSPIASSATTVGTLLPGAIVGGVVTLPDWQPGENVTFGIGVDGPGGAIALNYGTWTEPASTIASVGLPANYFTASLVMAAYPAGGIGPVPIGIVVGTPEPGALTLIGLGFAAWICYRRL